MAKAHWHNGRPGVVREPRGRPELLRAAGLREVTSRSALLDLPAPLLLDPDDAAWLGHRPDLHLLISRTLHTGQAPRR